jgi:hypothetical protein
MQMNKQSANEQKIIRLITGDKASLSPGDKIAVLSTKDERHYTPWDKLSEQAQEEWENVCV